ncbi:uncharacterized protein TRUGW13939_06852 [Talaromyces rugulosus]|uniref:ABC transporter domain-containing protein n=1 Tax=Talaromyces rugulosus TaxID=121627 RepID=A0A7H8R036_TALRU|nr:uncharacterized protein TRUGW13939_06852 [Talaromyces rugulosus]QKX59712.1 hypothetical protein TRUGW13939_06852 [Talaromyces rugulosus]
MAEARRLFSNASLIFWDALTVREHVQIWRILRIAASGTQLINDADVISECDLNDKIGAAAKTLSGGQKRKLQLAMAFAGGSKMVCIDEASSGLDPLSRRNIWDIIQKGRSRRTTLITTHFLDEADVLADHIVVLYRGHLVCQGSSTALKDQHGDGYRVASINSLQEGNTLGWKFDTSVEATHKVIELESANEVCDVIYPTLEQVFLKVTSDSNSARHIGGDGLIGDEEAQTAINNKSDFLEEEIEGSSELNLDVAKSIGMIRQVWVLFRKRYMLLRSSWFAYLVNLAIPIVVAAILFKYIQDWTTLDTCDMQRDALLSGAPLARIPSYRSLAGD